MPEIVRVRESRYRDDREDYSSDDEMSSHGHSRGYKTVQRYRVTPGRVEEVDDERRTTRSERVDLGGRNERLEIDRRVERVDRIERPRSAIDRYREPENAHEASRTIVYERERTRDRSPETASTRPWDRERDRAWERERDIDVRIERRHREDEPVELERYQRETEYYARPDPSPQPIVIRQRAPEPQKIIVEAASPPPPIILPQERQGYEIVRREEIVDNREVAPRREEDYYYRRDVREVNPRKDEAAIYDRRERHERHRAPSDDEYSDSSELIIRKERKVARPRSHSPYHKLHLAEGALAGAGAAALIANHRDKAGSGPDHRGRKVAGGAALGAIGAEIITRARSHYRDRDNRSRSSSRGNHTKLKTGLALAATALAAAAAGKYISNRNERKEEMQRGRSRKRSVSRRRASTGDYDSDRTTRSKSKHTDPKHQAATMAKAGAAAAAVAGIAQRLRSKSRGRSKSRLRTGAEIAATGLAGAAVAGLYEKRKAKQETANEAAEKRSRSRSRRRSRSTAYSDPGTDPELGMVQYGADPVYTQARGARTHAPGYYDPASPSADDAAYERSRSRHGASRSRSRSLSRVRGIAGGALGAGATAIGYDQYQKRKDKKADERARRRYEEEAATENFYTNESYDDGFSPSPPRASGGAYYPPHPQYNPADSLGHSPPMDPYPYPSTRTRTREGQNVSPHHSESLIPLGVSTPQFRYVNTTLDEEGSLSPLSFSTPSPPLNKSVNFAPLSPESSRCLTHRRQRRNSDPSFDCPNTPSRHRKRHHNPACSPSLIRNDTVEELPPRFDKDGHPLEMGLDESLGVEMVERIMNNFDDILEGRKTWRSLLRAFWEESKRR